MLVLSRRPQETIVIDNNIRLTVISVGRDRVRLGIEAPPHVSINRQEVELRIAQETETLSEEHLVAVSI